MKILLVSTFPTHPACSGNRAWILGQSEILQRLGHEVHYLFVLHPSFRAVSADACLQTRAYWQDKYYEYSLSLADKVCIKLRSLVSRVLRRSITCDEKYPHGLSKYVYSLQTRNQYDMCIVQYFFLTKLFDKVRFPKTALSTHDCFSYRDIRTDDKGTMSLTANEEAKAMQRCKYIFALQEEERAYFAHLSPKSVVLNVFGKFDYVHTPVVHNHNMVFLGSDINYNTMAIRSFVKNVLPLLREQYADTCLIVGGSVCRGLNDLAGTPGLELKGVVEHPIDLYRLADIAINPVCQGTGLKIKTFESLGYGKITLVHPHSVQGIYKQDEAPLFVLNTPEEWVKCLNNIWQLSSDELELLKQKDSDYLDLLKNYVFSQYKRLSDR